MKRFNVVFSKDDGGIEVHRMKEWLRQHPNDPVSSSKLDTLDLGCGVQDSVCQIRGRSLWTAHNSATRYRA
jgi:hypothetical protein